MTTIDWLHYDALFSVIRAHGFTARPLPSGGTRFVHPDGAELAFPATEPDAPVHRLHYGATVTALTNYDIMTQFAIDFALPQVAHKLPTPA